MVHVVLARKYRPRSFEQMVGQDAVVRALSNALQQQRLHHAYLFSGTRGIGKTTVSRILAKSLNCTGPDGQGGITAHPCGRCTACTEIDADRYIDYIELDAASNRGIDEIRDLLERAAYKPSVGRFKVFMIDEAHQLTKESFNALLKTLEEPPEYLKFVLATTDPDKMLPTVLSRCLQFNLRPIAPEIVQAHLAQVLEAEQVAIDAASLRLLARAARGSMRDALSLADQAIAYGGGQVDEATVRTMLGSVDRGHAAQLVRGIAQRDGAAVLASVAQLRDQGLSAAATLEEIAALLQQMAVVQAVPDALDNADPDTPTARELAPLLPADETQLLYSIVLHGRAELSLAPDEYAGLTMTLLRLFAFPAQGDDPPDIVPGAASRGRGSAALKAAPHEARASAPARVQSVEKPAPASGASAAAAARRTSVPEPPPWLDASPPVEDAPPLRSVVPADDRLEPAAQLVPARWQATILGDRSAAAVAQLQAGQAITAMVRELALQAELVAIDDGDVPRWRLRVARDSLRTAPLCDKLQAALCATLGTPLQLLLEAGEPADSPALREAAERERRQRQAEEFILNDPLVRQLMAQFSTARIVPGSIKPH